jgi:hypothetical protein
MTRDVPASVRITPVALSLLLALTLALANPRPAAARQPRAPIVHSASAGQAVPGRSTGVALPPVGC